MVDIRGLNGGMNTDSAIELLPNGDYTYAMNVSVGSGGMVNLPGNRLVENFPPNTEPGGEWICGSFFDKVRQRVIYFTNHERGNHRIISYEAPSVSNINGAYIVLFENTNNTFSYWGNYIQFDPNALIKDIKVIHREYEGDLYYFIDPAKKLRKFNYSTLLKYRAGDNQLCAFGWTSANYDGTTLNDGTPIQQVTDPTIWAGLTVPAWCYYNNDAANNDTYGKLYNWYAVSHPLFAPVGYRVPTVTDWNNLITCLGGTFIAGGKLKAVSSLWQPPNLSATNESLFTAVPGGTRTFNGSFDFVGRYSSWWSSTGVDSQLANSATVGYFEEFASVSTEIKTSGLSVRLIKEN